MVSIKDKPINILTTFRSSTQLNAMETEETFLPAGTPPSLHRLWLLFLVVVIINVSVLFAVGFETFVATLMAASVFIAFSVIILIRRAPISVTISRADAKLYFKYANCFGQVKENNVYIPTAKLSYRQWQTRYGARFMSIVIYNNIFTNYVSLSENASGYSRQQLDVIDEHLKALRTVPA